MSQYKASETDSATELKSPRYSSEAATEVTKVVVVLDVPKLAEVLSPQPRLGGNRKDCAVVAFV